MTNPKRREVVISKHNSMGVVRAKKGLDGAVRIRKATEADVNFIFSCWLKSYRDSFFAQCISTTVYFSEHHKVVERLLQSCDVWVACSDTDVGELYGFICGERVQGLLVIHYAYVKHNFRWLGIGRKLLECFNYDGSTGIYTHLTKNSRALSTKFGFVHSPYLAFTPEYRKEVITAPLTQEKKEEIYGEQPEPDREPEQPTGKRLGPK